MNQRNAIHVPVFDGMTLRTAHFDTLCVDTLCVGSENLSIRVTLSPVLAQELWWICYHCTWEKHVKWSKVPSCVGCAQLGYGRWGRWGQWCLVSKNRLDLQRTTMHCQDESCPLCMQTLDETDISFFACPCNYQAIETCHHFSVFFLRKSVWTLGKLWSTRFASSVSTTLWSRWMANARHADRPCAQETW